MSPWDRGIVLNREKTHHTLGERLDWQWYQRDDHTVAAALAAGDEIDDIYPLDAGALLDGYWHFLDEAGVLRLMAEQPVEQYQRKALSIFALTALCHLKALMAIEAIDSLPALLFSDPVAMSLLGGAGELVSHGLTQRGQHRRKGEPDATRTMDADIVGDFMARWTPKETETFLNGVIAAMAAAGAYGKWVRAIMDGSHLHTTQGFVFTHKWWSGLKLLLLWDAFTGLPLAAKVVDTDTYEAKWTLSLLRQAQRNLGEHSRIGEFVADRLYVNGTLLYLIDQQDILFAIRAKVTMDIHVDALSMVAAGKGQRQERGEGKNAVVAIGLKDLTTYNDYNDPREARHQNRKDYAPTSLNVVVIKQSPGMKGDCREPWVLMTNDPSSQPLDIYDRYDDRSLIENLGFREGKQGWNLERPPQRNEGAYTTHVLLTLAVYACVTAYRARCEREEKAEVEAAKKPARASKAVKSTAEDEMRRPVEAIRHYRKRLAQENKGKVWVRVGEVYGILHLAELSILSGIRLKDVPREVGTREYVFRRYGLEPPS